MNKSKRVHTLDCGKHIAEIARIATEEAQAFFRRHLDIDYKADESPVTYADKHIETVVRDYLTRHFPEDSIFGEEHGFTRQSCNRTWVIDPIDGTRSFLSGHPLFGFLLGYIVKGQPEIGVICMPMLEECLIGIRGCQATLNGNSISVSNASKLHDAVFFVNEGDRLHNEYPALFNRLMHCGKTRRFAYDCYSYALLAMGYVDAVIECGLKPYDYLPLSAVVEAAGGVITDWNGRPLTFESDGRVISAATPALHAELLNLARGA